MKRSLILIALLMLTVSTANAQFVEQGDREITFSGSLFSVSGLTMILMSGSYGIYHTERFEYGGGPTITYMSFGDDSNTTVGGTAFIKYTMEPRERLVPYLGARWYQFDFAPEEPVGFGDAAYLQFGGGLKYFLNEYVSYDLSTNLGFSLGDGDAAFLAVFGISAIF